MIYWNRPYGWRAGTRYVESGANAADVIRYECDELGNTLDIPPFLLEALEAVPARKVVWVCRTRRHAQRYAGREIGQPYQEDIGKQSVILTTDTEQPETGYLVLTDPTMLHPAIMKRLTELRSR